MEHQFVLIGSGTSTGVPMPGCSCNVCSSDNPFNFRDRTAGLIRFNSGLNALIDATPDLRHQAIKHRIKRVDAVLFTHSHADHICGTDDLRAFNFVQKHRIECFGSPETLAGIKSMFPYIFKHDQSYLGGLTAQLNLNEITNFEPFKFDNNTIYPFPLPHGNTVVTGYRIGNLGYATDCKGLSEKAYEILKGVDFLFLDGIRWKQHRTHNTIDEAIEIAQHIKAKQTYLIHMTHDVDHDEVCEKLPPAISLGYDGLTIKFNVD